MYLNLALGDFVEEPEPDDLPPFDEWLYRDVMAMRTPMDDLDPA
jgi:hypothetical protein